MNVVVTLHPEPMLKIELDSAEMERLRGEALACGEPLEEYVTQRLLSASRAKATFDPEAIAARYRRDRPQRIPRVVSEQAVVENTPLIDLLDQQLAAASHATPDERAEADRELTDFLEALNAERMATGSRRVF